MACSAQGGLPMAGGESRSLHAPLQISVTGPVLHEYALGNGRGVWLFLVKGPFNNRGPVGFRKCSVASAQGDDLGIRNGRMAKAVLVKRHGTAAVLIKRMPLARELGPTNDIGGKRGVKSQGSRPPCA